MPDIDASTLPAGPVEALEESELDMSDESDSDEGPNTTPGFATSPEELQAQIKRIILDMIAEQRQHQSSPPRTSGSASHTDPDTTNPDTTDPDATDPNTTDPDTTDPDAANPHVTMCKLPENVDQAITEFLNDMFARYGVAQDESDSETSSEGNDIDTDRRSDEMEVESILDMESEDENEAHHEFDLNSDVLMTDVDGSKEWEPLENETDMPGAR
ncbi:hypothetical protein FRC11_011146, partial [Ceratobasidium sp. 423]